MKEGVFLALNDIISSIPAKELALDKNTFTLTLSERDDCRKSIPPFYYVNVIFAVKIDYESSNDSSNIVDILYTRFSSYVRSKDILIYLIRAGLSINKDVKEVKMEHVDCIIYTEGPSFNPTSVSSAPSIYKSPEAVSLLFQLALAGKKTAAELSSCCRNQVLSGMRTLR